MERPEKTDRETEKNIKTEKAETNILIKEWPSANNETKLMCMRQAAPKEKSTGKWVGVKKEEKLKITIFAALIFLSYVQEEHDRCSVKPISLPTVEAELTLFLGTVPT